MAEIRQMEKKLGVNRKKKGKKKPETKSHYSLDELFSDEMFGDEGDGLEVKPPCTDPP